jgi:predicted nucleic acid-binding protein
MSLTIVLDTGPLGKVTNPTSSPENDAAAAWLQDHLLNGTRVVIPEIANYELRRELLLGNKLRGLRALDNLIHLVDYEPITTEAIYEAARTWAEARRQGMATAHQHALDGDMILVAQVRLMNDPAAIVATVDVGDLPRFIPAKHWQDILPDPTP